MAKVRKRRAQTAFGVLGVAILVGVIGWKNAGAGSPQNALT
jgi:hypothetical protein